MIGKRGTQQGEKRGTYNTPGTKQIKIKLDVLKSGEVIKENFDLLESKTKNIKRIKK